MQRSAAAPRRRSASIWARMSELAEQIAQFGIGIEGQWILALGTVQHDRAHAVADGPAEVAGHIAGERNGVACMKARGG